MSRPCLPIEEYSQIGLYWDMESRIEAKMGSVILRGEPIFQNTFTAQDMYLNVVSTGLGLENRLTRQNARHRGEEHEPPSCSILRSSCNGGPLT